MGDPKVPKIVLLVGLIMKNQDEDEIPKVKSKMAIAIVMDPANGSGKTFTRMLEYGLASEFSDAEYEDDAENVDVDMIGYYSPVDSEAFCRD